MKHPREVEAGAAQGQVDSDALFALTQAPLVLASRASGRIVRCSRAFAALFGATPEQVTGQAWADLLHEADQWPSLVLPAGARGPVTRVLRHPSGTPVSITWTTVAIVEEPGESRVIGAVQAQEEPEPRGPAGWDLQRIREDLRGQQTWFRDLADTLPVIVWVTSADGECQFLNRTWYAITGQGEAEALGQGWTSAVHPEDRVQIVEAVTDSVSGQRDFEAQYRLRRADGSYIWMLDRGRVLAGPDGRPVARVGVMMNIDEQRRGASALAEARALLDAIFESAPVGIGFWDCDLRFSRVNRTLARINGLPIEAHLGKTPAELLPGIRDVEILMQRWRVMLATGQPMANVEVVGETPAEPGRQRSWEETFFPVRKGGETVGLAAVVQDTTDRRTAERALRESEARFRKLTEVAPIMAWTADAEGGLLYASPSMLAFTGMTLLELRRVDAIRDVVHPEDVERVIAAWQTALETATPFDQEYRMRRREDGQYRWFLSRAVPECDGDGRAAEWVGANVDITESRQATAALQEADRHKDEFLAMLAHELRNPLGPIRNAVHLLRVPGVDESVLQTARDMIDRQVTHIVRLVDDLLDISRLSRGSITLKPSLVDLVAVVRDSIADYRPVLTAADIGLTEELPGHSLWLQADPTRLAQIVGNLLHNARKFTPSGGNVTVSLTTGERGRQASLRVRDTGVGIEADLLPRIFDPFRQGRQGLDRGRGGLGLGLSLVRGLATLHGGSVAVHSAGVNRGSEFVVTLPLSFPAAAGPVRAARPADIPRRRVLVVEDNQDSAESLRLLLTLAGHDVRVAETGTSGVGIAQTFRPDVTICDVGLPGGMNGYDVARAIRAYPELQQTLLVALTGYGRDEDVADAMRAGFDVHLTKPVDFTSLRDLLAAHTGGR